MRVIMVSHIPLPEDNVRGGVEAVTLGLLKGFARCQDIQIKFLSFGHDRDLTVQLYDNVEVCYVKRKYRVRKLELWLHARKVVRRVFDEWKADIIHIEGNGSLLLLLQRDLAERTVVTQHGIMARERKNTKSLRRKINLLAAQMIEHHKWPLVKNIIFISDYNKNLCKNLDHLKWVKIYNPVGDDYFIQSDVFGRGFCFIGRLNELKGVRDLFLAMASLPEDISLNVIGGPDTKEYMAELEGIASSLPPGRIKMHGWQNGEGIRSITERDCCLVLPSNQEILPVVIAEAMAMGKIVIATDVGGVSEMVENGVNGFMYRAGNINGLIQCFQKVMALSDSELKTMQNNAVRLARERYYSVSIAEKTADFYREI
ncbi:MAG: glycosyltransferase family 4 protein [Bacteroidales bacterium]|nr:glycosyltransferase family 4 protein [Bacteroidales bacterium]